VISLRSLPRIAGLSWLLLFVPAAFPQTDVPQANAQKADAQKAPAPAVTCNPALTAGPDGTHPCDALNDDAGKGEAVKPEDQDRPVVQQDDFQVKPLNFQYVPALNGGAPIIAPQPFGFRYLYGGSTTQGYDTTPGAADNTGGTWASVFDGYAAASAQLPGGYLLIQQASTFSHYGATAIQGQSFHRTAVLASGSFTHSLIWSFEANNAVGEDQLQLINPITEKTVGQFATQEPGAAIAGLNNGLIWGADAAGMLTWNLDPTRSVIVRVRDAYHRVFGDDTHDNISDARVEYQKAFSERTTFGVYGQTIRQTGDSACNSNGAGIKGSTKPTRDALVQFEVGPEFDSAGCMKRQGLNFRLAAVDVLNSTTRAYVTASREFSSGYVTRGTWEDNVVIGFGKTLGPRLTWSANGGYVRGDLSTGTIPSYHGYFADTELRHKLSKSLTAVATYRRFDHTVAQAALHRNVAFVSLIWTPAGHSAHRAPEFRPVEGTTSEPGGDQ